MGMMWPRIVALLERRGSGEGNENFLWLTWCVVFHGPKFQKKPCASERCALMYVACSKIRLNCSKSIAYFLPFPFLLDILLCFEFYLFASDQKKRL